MSFVGTLVAACIHPSEIPQRLAGLDDLATVDTGRTAAVYVFSRNGWINNRLEELALLEYVELAPTSLSPVKVSAAGVLPKLAGDLKSFLERLSREPRLLPYGAREQATEEELLRVVRMAPASLQEALSALEESKRRDEDAERLETLVCLLWCLLRLAEYAAANGLHVVLVRSQ